MKACMKERSGCRTGRSGRRPPPQREARLGCRPPPPGCSPPPPEKGRKPSCSLAMSRSTLMSTSVVAVTLMSTSVVEVTLMSTSILTFLAEVMSLLTFVGASPLPELPAALVATALKGDECSSRS